MYHDIKGALRDFLSKKQWKPLAVSVGISLLAGVLSGILTSGSMETYDQIPKPPLAPPGIVFPIVWTILYILMGMSAGLVYIAGKEGSAGRAKTRQALWWYKAQLAVNVVWPVIFFNWHMYLLALAWLLLLWYLVFMTARKFYKISPVAGWLMLPYLIWLTFAGYLNLAIVLLQM